MIKRDIEKQLITWGKKFPAIAIVGPRQSGKTTLSQLCFSNHKYFSLEDPDTFDLISADPKGFLDSAENKFGIILDEFQNFPEILSYIQGYVDREYRPGYFILTGSQNFLINESITQTLAGRIGIITLLPLSMHELKKNALLPKKVETLILDGQYPRLYSQKFTREELYPSYIKTYVERDVRQIKNITDLRNFQKFLKLCAGRIGQVINLTSLASDCELSVPTAKSWISLLEASYIVFTLQPYYNNLNKRLIKSPKLYFYDTGLACSLLSIENEEQLFSHYLKGGLFESLILSDIMKNFYNRAVEPSIYFFRDNHGNEIDCIIEKGGKTIPVEIKAGKTVFKKYLEGIEYWNSLTNSSGGYLVSGADEKMTLKGMHIVPWFDTEQILPD